MMHCENRYCLAPVEGRALEIWQQSLEPDEDGGMSAEFAEPLYCWECHCWNKGICEGCGRVLTPELACVNMECDLFGGRSQM